VGGWVGGAGGVVSDPEETAARPPREARGGGTYPCFAFRWRVRAEGSWVLKAQL
jgi:hypothetical protein